MRKAKRLLWEYPQGRDNQVAYTIDQKQLGYKDVSGLYLARLTVYTAVILRVPEREGDFWTNFCTRTPLLGISYAYSSLI